MRAVLLSLGLFLAACSSSTSPQQTTAPVANDGVQTGGPSSVVATLERIGCYGFCPVYKVSIHEDGTVVYVGERFVKTTGEQRGQLSPDELQQLHAAFEKANYFALNDRYEDRQVTDNPSAHTSYTRDGKTKTVRHYHGDPSAPAELGWLEDEIDRIVRIERWIGTDEEREQLSGGWRR